jgi:hypothetical protein
MGRCRQVLRDRRDRQERCLLFRVCQLASLPRLFGTADSFPLLAIRVSNSARLPRQRQHPAATQMSPSLLGERVADPLHLIRPQPSNLPRPHPRSPLITDSLPLRTCPLPSKTPPNSLPPRPNPSRSSSFMGGNANAASSRRTQRCRACGCCLWKSLALALGRRSSRVYM